MQGKCDGCGREGIVGTTHRRVWTKPLEGGELVQHRLCGTFRRPEPAEPEVTHTPRFCAKPGCVECFGAEPETKDALFPSGAAPKRLVGEES